MKNNQSERKKSALPFRINKQSFFGVLSLIFQELIDRLLTKFHFRLPKEEEVLRRVRKNAIANDPSSVLNIIDDFAYKKTFLMNIGDEKGLILEKAINDSNAKNILELGVYLGYSTIRILRNLDNFSKLTSIESNKKFAEIAKEHIKISGLSERTPKVVPPSCNICFACCALVMAICLFYFVSPNKSRLGIITLTSFLMSDSGMFLAFHSLSSLYTSPVFI